MRASDIRRGDILMYDASRWRRHDIVGTPLTFLLMAATVGGLSVALPGGRRESRGEHRGPARFKSMSWTSISRTKK